MNALADARVADYINENFISTYLKVGTFQIINGQKVGGNVASYFCLGDKSVIHAVPGKLDANQTLSEARWAYETRKAARSAGINARTGLVDAQPYADRLKKAHVERYHSLQNGLWGGGIGGRMPTTIPAVMPRNGTQQAQAHWLLASRPMASLDDVYGIVWTQILREQLSTLPVARR